MTNSMVTKRCLNISKIIESVSIPFVKEASINSTHANYVQCT